ncbi:MAG: type 2 isopentenyl-diphosphate Delta-isomerase [Promethearchaeota archaeon]
MILISIPERKRKHVEICQSKDVQMNKTNAFEGFDLVPFTLPELDLKEIDTQCKFLGHDFNFPLMITALTGGFPGAETINKNIAFICQELGIGMGVGSQRAAIEDPALSYTYKVRDIASDIFLAGNLGIAQIASEYGVQEAEQAIQMIDADALAIHLNPLHEVLQTGGDPNFKGGLNSLQQLCNNSKYPVIAKESGSGIDMASALSLKAAGVAAIDVSGAGGVSWAKVAKYQNEEDIAAKTNLELLEDWGIPSAYSISECYQATNLPIIGSGGIRNGLEIVKALILGADIVGIALPILRAHHQGGKSQIKGFLTLLMTQVKRSMFLLGCSNLNDLKNARNRIVLRESASNWFKTRGLKPPYLLDNIEV